MVFISPSTDLILSPTLNSIIQITHLKFLLYVHSFFMQKIRIIIYYILTNNFSKWQKNVASFAYKCYKATLLL